MPVSGVREVGQVTQCVICLIFMIFQIVAAVLLGVRREREAKEGLKDELNADKCPKKVDTHVFRSFPSSRCTTVPQKLPKWVAAVLHGTCCELRSVNVSREIPRSSFSFKLAARRQGYSRPHNSLSARILDGCDEPCDCTGSNLSPCTWQSKDVDWLLELFERWLHE